MKKIVFVPILLFTLLLSSCLGDTTESGTLENVLGTISKNPEGTTLVYTYFGPLSIPELNNMDFDVDDCISVSFKWDMGDPENTNAEKNGYVYAKLLGSKPEKFDKGVAHIEKTDTTTLVENEFSLNKSAGIDGVNHAYHFFNLNGTLILTFNYSGVDDKLNNWNIYYDKSLEPSIVENNNIYTLHLRAARTNEEEIDKKTIQTKKAFIIRNILDDIQQREKTKGNKQFGIKIRYVNEINETTETFSWAETIPFSYIVE